GLVQAEKAQLAHTLEHPIGEGRLLPLFAVGLELLDHEAPDRVAQLLVLVGEDEVLALAGVVGFEDVGGGHAGWDLSDRGAAPGTLAAARREVNSRASYSLLTARAPPRGIHHY